MDHYTIIRLYHQALQRWWTKTIEKDNYTIAYIDLESIFIHIFKSFPTTKILLLSSNGKCTTVSTMEETPPSLFRKYRYMKIDNKTSLSSIKNVIPVFYQLLSIDINETLSVLDILALIKWIQLLMSETMIDFTSCDFFVFIRKQFYHGPDFLPELEKESWKKEIRDPILTCFYEKDIELICLKKNEMHLVQLQECYQLLEKINKTLTLHEERMDMFFEWICKEDGIVF